MLTRTKRLGDLRGMLVVARGDDHAASDVDFLVDLDQGVGVVALTALKRELAELVGVDVDVVPAEMLKAQIRSEVLREAIPL